MNFFEMLTLSKKLSFVDGRVLLFNQGISIYPARSMMNYMKLINNDPDSIKLIYSMAKQSMMDHKQDLLTAHDPSNAVSWVINTINLYGLGKMEYLSKTLEGEITIENSPFVENLKGTVSVPVDNITRGIIAGIVSSISNFDYDVIELNCAAVNGDKCKLIIYKKENLLSKFPLECKSQIL
ncbi:MAG: 4-vinyl reductase [Candidatus Micrarchaeota archaeon]|nr:4-vinyl reductase [Candidatus Micrarchaeota archaeon]